MSDLFGIEEETDEMRGADERALKDIREDNPEEPEDIGLDDFEMPEEDEEERPSRKDKKAQRPGLMEALEKERSKSAEMAERLSRLEGYAQAVSMQARHSGAPTQPQQDQIQTQIDKSYSDEDSLKKEAEAVYAQASMGNRTITEADQEGFKKRYQEITQRRAELTSMKVMRDNGIRPSNPAEGIQAAIQAQYPDVYGHQQASNYVRGRWQQYRALGYHDTPQLLATVMKEARQQFKLSPPNSPISEQRRQKYTGSAGAGGSTGNRPQSSNTVRMTPDMKSIAEEHYSHRQNLTAHQKHQLWAKEIGPEFLKMQRGG